VRFWDYEFEVLDEDIIFDEELTAEQLSVKPGDGFITFVQEDGTVILRKIDLAKVEQIKLKKVKVAE
jgi:hypothetical protein